MIEYTLADWSSRAVGEVDDYSRARVENSDAGVGRVPALVDRTLAERTLGVPLRVRHVDHVTRRRRVRPRQRVLAHHDGATCRQRAERHDADGADDAPHRAVSSRPLAGCVRPEMLQ